MTQIEEVIRKLSAGMPARAELPTATDDEVQAKIEEFAAQGYIPGEHIIGPIRDYMSGRGVILSGPAGTGKTWLMTLLRARLYGARRIAEYGIRGIDLWFSWTDGYDICIDDLGEEPSASEYGARDEVLRAVIEHRALAPQHRTSFTTNMDGAAIRDRYGDRALSRLLGMCSPHKFTGPNRRMAR